MIDPRIPLMGQQQQDTFGNLAQGIQMGQGLRQLISGRQLGKMQQLAPEDQQAFADKSMFSRELNAGMKANNAAQVAQAMALQKHNADIGKTQSEAFKNTTQGQGFGLENSGKKLGAIQGAFQQASLTGDKAQVLLGMNALVRTGMMSAEDYQSQAAIVSTMSPDELKQYAGGINFANAKDPAALQYQSADNSANNAQSDINNQRTTNASMYSTDVGAETANKNREQQGQQYKQSFEYTAQQDEIKNGQGELKEFGGKGYIVYKDGSYRPAIGADGQQISSNKAETPEQKMERMDNIIGSKDAYRLATRAASDAEALMKHPGLYWGTGTTSAMGMVPGTDAKDFHARIENLKSQVFLPAVKAMQGMGALSNSEGDKISASIANLDTKLSPNSMKAQLKIIVDELSAAARVAEQKTQNYESRGGTIPLAAKPSANPPTEQRPQSYKGATTSLSSVKQAAQQAGISTEEMVSILKSQGAIIK